MMSNIGVDSRRNESPNLQRQLTAEEIRDELSALNRIANVLRIPLSERSPKGETTLTDEQRRGYLGQLLANDQAPRNMEEFTPAQTAVYREYAKREILQIIESVPSMRQRYSDQINSNNLDSLILPPKNISQ